MKSSLQARLWSTIAIVAALLVAMAGLSAPAEALTARTVTLSASPSLEYAAKPVTFSGKVTKSPAGSVVKIQRKSGTTWVAAGQTTSTGTGTFSKVLVLPATPAAYSYRALAPKTTKLAGVYSKTFTVKALRKTTATLTATPSTINTGGTTTLTGTVSPFVAGTKIAVQRLSGSSWVQVTTVALTSGGGFSLNLTPSVTSTYRVQTPLTGLNAGTVSLDRVVTVTNANSPTITTTSLPNGDQGLAYTTTLTHTGGAGTWAVPPGTLPTGLTLNASTGVLAGTPTGSGTRNLSVTFTETSSGLAVNKTLAITITAGPTITTATLPHATRGTAYSVTLAKTGLAGTWTVQGLPGGLSINADTGQITGTTFAAVGEYGVYPKFTETGTGRFVQKALSLTVDGSALTITTDATLPDGHKDLPYSVTFTRSGGPGTWALAQGPEGFTINAETGTLTGTPTVAGLYSIFVSFTETNGTFVQKGFSLTVVRPKVTTTTIPGGVTGTAYSVQFAKTGLDGTWSYTGAVPDGLVFTDAGLLSGTPTETGEFPLTVTFTETATGNFSKQAYVLHVEAPGSPTITTTSLPNGTIGTPYSAMLAATPTGGTWVITTGSLPVGLELNATTGAITGTPTVPENALFIVTYTKGATHNTKFFSLTVPTPPAG